MRSKPRVDRIPGIAAPAAGPWLAIRGISEAIEQRDAARLARHVDFPALRINLKAQLDDQLVRRAGSDMQSSLFGVMALGVAGRPQASAADDGPPLKAALGEAMAHPSFWMLNLGFFVCGFHIAFVGTHLPAYLRDQGLTPGVGAMCLALIGLFNILGSAAWGALGSRYSKKWLLVMVYGLRAVAIAVFLLVPISAASALVFASSFGFLWLGTVPLTNGLIALIYGVRNLSALGGIVFLSHQVGAFLGAWLAGVAFTALGSYDAIWIASVLLAILAAIANVPIREVSLRAASAPV